MTQGCPIPFGFLANTTYSTPPSAMVPADIYRRKSDISDQGDLVPRSSSNDRRFTGGPARQCNYRRPMLSKSCRLWYCPHCFQHIDFVAATVAEEEKRKKIGARAGSF